MSENEFEKNSDLHKFYAQFSSVIKDAYGIYETCKNVASDKITGSCKVVENINDIWNGKEKTEKHITDDGKYCDYLFYWMFDKVEECKYNVACMIWLYNKFEEFWKSISCCGTMKDDKCENFTREFDMKVLKSKKEIYKFVEYYNILENILMQENSEKKKLYCMYAKYMFDLYHLMNYEFDKYGFKKYEKELKLFKNTFENSNKLSNLKEKCNNSDLSITLHRKEYNKDLTSEYSIDRLTPNTYDFSERRQNAIEGMNDIVKGEPSYVLYKEFDKDTNDAETDKLCNEHFKEESIYKIKSIEICKKIVNNLKHLYSFESTLNSNERCLHYKNWVYNEILNMITNNSYNNDVWNIIDKFISLQNKKKQIVDANTITFCHYYFIFKDLLELSIKREEKDLHDYFKYYDTLENKIPLDDNNKKKYRNYLDYINILYTRHKIAWYCCDESYGVDPLCRHYFKCEDEYNPNYLLSLLDGKPDISYKEKKKNFPVVVFGEEQLRNTLKEEDVMRIQHGRCTYVYDPKDKKKIFGRRCDYRASREHFHKIHSNLTNPKNNDAPKVTIPISSLPVILNNTSDISNTEANESNPSHFKIGTSVALALGGIFIFFLYYKFTPFGSLFGKRGQGKTNFEEDFNEEYMREFSYDSEYEDINPQNRRIHIAYQRE
ncbi:PIR protein [Plasmodium ovale]|uniref:PIR protein n=1 Tax=Plasmodium ovale TaxID=36330 RepID=A0A1D3JFF5_PLAOA|nr:PIR protein [Plasmodium ovale]